MKDFHTQLSDLKKKFLEDVAKHDETCALYKETVAQREVLEAQFHQLGEIFATMEKNLLQKDAELHEAKRKIARLRQLRIEAEARTMKHQFIDIYNLSGFTFEYERFVKEFPRNMWDKGVVVYIDMDGFKTINDLLGHDVGNEILIEFGECVRHCLRPEDTAACLHGDEFALLLPGSDKSGADQVVERIRRTTKLIALGRVSKADALRAFGRDHVVSFSTGYCLIDGAQSIPDVHEALRIAEAAVPKFERRRVAYASQDNEKDAK
jgi:diguanylate cyclase (GGDEF)-like protein